MLIKKLLISLGILGTVGATGTGVYYLKNKSSDAVIQSTIKTEGTVAPTPEAQLDTPGELPTAPKGTEAPGKPASDPNGGT